MRNYRLGIWAGIAGIATILIVGSRTIWMVAIIIGLIIGLLSTYNESIKTARDGLRFGAINGAIAGALLIVGQLLRSLWLDPLAGQPQLDLGFGLEVNLAAHLRSLVRSSSRTTGHGLPFASPRRTRSARRFTSASHSSSERSSTGPSTLCSSSAATKTRCDSVNRRAWATMARVESSGESLGFSLTWVE